MEIIQLLTQKEPHSGLLFADVFNYMDKTALKRLLKGKKTKKLDHVFLECNDGMYIVDEIPIRIFIQNGFVKFEKKIPKQINGIYNIPSDAYQKANSMIKKFRSIDRGIDIETFLLDTNTLEFVKAFSIILRPILQSVISATGFGGGAAAGAGVASIATAPVGGITFYLTSDLLLDICILIFTMQINAVQIGSQLVRLVSRSKELLKIFDIITEHVPNIDPRRKDLKSISTLFNNFTSANIFQIMITSFANGPEGLDAKLRDLVCKTPELKKVFKENCEVISSVLSSITTLVSLIISAAIPGDMGIAAFFAKGGMEVGFAALSLIKVDIFEAAKKVYNKIPEDVRHKTDKPGRLEPQFTGFLQDTERMTNLFVNSVVTFRDILQKIFNSDFLTKPNSNPILEKFRKDIAPKAEQAKNVIAVIDDFLVTNMIGVSNFIMFIQSTFWVFLWLSNYCNKELKC